MNASCGKQEYLKIVNLDIKMKLKLVRTTRYRNGD